MKPRTHVFRRFLISSFFLLIFALNPLAAELQIYYMPDYGVVPFWEWTLWVMDADGSNKREFFKPPVPMNNAQIAPAGKRILFTTLPQDHDVWGVPKYKLTVMNFDGSNLREFLVNPPHPGSAWGKWSPDGKRVLYTSFKPQRPIVYELYVSDAEGGNSFQVASNIDNRFGILNSNWFPDSRRIAFSLHEPNFASDLYLVDATLDAEAEPMKIKLFQVSTIRWSPDGRRTILTGVKNANERNEIFLGDAMGRNLIRLTHDADDQSGTMWLPDGKHIIYWTDSERPDIAIMNVDTKKVRRLTDDGQSALAFWYDPTLPVNPAGKLVTSWGAIKSQFGPRE